MNEKRRQQVRDNARYLREVRPIDPEEIHEYVEGTPHPAAVRQVLREEAADLELLERPDGRFEPVGAGSLSVDFGGVDTLPATLTRAIEDLLVDAFGPGWPDGESGETLRRVIRDFKRRYLQDAPVTYDESTALGYALYHLPPYFRAVQTVFAELAADGLLDRKLRILDVGAGVGGPALGIDALLGEETLVEYHAVEPSEAASILQALLAETGRNFHPTVHRTTIETFEPAAASGDSTFDVLLFANVLSELDDPAEILCDVLDYLAPDGTVVALAPADRTTATRLRSVERTVEGASGLSVYGPTVRLWPGERPASESWSFRRDPPLERPNFQHRLDVGTRTEAERRQSNDQDFGEASVQPPGSGEFVNVDVQYAYGVMRPDGKQAVRFSPDAGRLAKMSRMDDHVTERIDCAGIKLSHDLADGDNSVFLVGDGSQQVDHVAVLTSVSALNRDLARADYGDLLLFENVLVLWNEDENAYNLVVDDEAVVDRLPA